MLCYINNEEIEKSSFPAFINQVNTGDEPMTNTMIKTGVTTRKELNKECLKIDLEKVELGRGLWKPSLTPM